MDHETQVGLLHSRLLLNPGTSQQLAERVSARLIQLYSDSPKAFEASDDFNLDFQ